MGSVPPRGPVFERMRQVQEDVTAMRESLGKEKEPIVRIESAEPGMSVVTSGGETCVSLWERWTIVQIIIG